MAASAWWPTLPASECWRSCAALALCRAARSPRPAPAQPAPIQGGDDQAHTTQANSYAVIVFFSKLRHNRGYCILKLHFSKRQQQKSWTVHAGTTRAWWPSRMRASGEKRGLLRCAQLRLALHLPRAGLVARSSRSVRCEQRPGMAGGMGRGSAVRSHHAVLARLQLGDLHASRGLRVSTPPARHALLCP